MKIEAVKGKSPYAKRQKVPHKYSEHYSRWSSCVARSGIYSEETLDADRSFRKAFNIPTFKRPAEYGGFK
jgi:hypothetical protein